MNIIENLIQIVVVIQLWQSKSNWTVFGQWDLSSNSIWMAWFNLEAPITWTYHTYGILFVYFLTYANRCKTIEKFKFKISCNQQKLSFFPGSQRRLIAGQQGRFDLRSLLRWVLHYNVLPSFSNFNFWKRKIFVQKTCGPWTEFKPAILDSKFFRIGRFFCSKFGLFSRSRSRFCQVFWKS